MIYIYIYLYMCLCMYVCACVSACTFAYFVPCNVTDFVTIRNVNLC